MGRKKTGRAPGGAAPGAWVLAFSDEHGDSWANTIGDKDKAYQTALWFVLEDQFNQEEEAKFFEELGLTPRYPKPEADAGCHELPDAIRDQIFAKGNDKIVEAAYEALGWEFNADPILRTGGAASLYERSVRFDWQVPR